MKNGDCSPLLSESDRQLLTEAGIVPSPTVRRTAVAMTLAQSGAVRDEAIRLLGGGFVRATQPSFHYIPKGQSMASEAVFEKAECTGGCRDCH